MAALIKKAPALLATAKEVAVPKLNTFWRYAKVGMELLYFSLDSPQLSPKQAKSNRVRGSGFIKISKDLGRFNKKRLESIILIFYSEIQYILCSPCTNKLTSRLSWPPHLLLTSLWLLLTSPPRLLMLRSNPSGAGR